MRIPVQYLLFNYDPFLFSLVSDMRECDKDSGYEVAAAVVLGIAVVHWDI